MSAKVRAFDPVPCHLAARGHRDAGPGAGQRFGPALFLGGGFLIAWLMAMALALRALTLPPEATGTVVVVFPPGLNEQAAFAAIVAAGGSPVRTALGTFTWIAHGEEPGFVARLETEGALAAFADIPIGITLAGCLGFIPRSHADDHPTAPLQPL